MTAMPRLALLAGGLATRMRPLTEKTPKSLLECAGEPFIAHQLRLFHRKGIREVVVCAGYLGSMIEDFIGNGSRFGVNVRYSFDGPVPLGTGGALLEAMPLLGNAFMVIYGDSWLDTDYSAVVDAFGASGKPALMTVFRNANAFDTSNVIFEDGRVRLYDKRNRLPQMHHIDWGMSLFRASAFEPWRAAGKFDLSDLTHKLSLDGDLAGFEVKERFYEIGSVTGLNELSDVLRR